MSLDGSRQARLAAAGPSVSLGWDWSGLGNIATRVAASLSGSRLLPRSSLQS